MRAVLSGSPNSIHNKEKDKTMINYEYENKDNKTVVIFVIITVTGNDHEGIITTPKSLKEDDKATPPTLMRCC